MMAEQDEPRNAAGRTEAEERAARIKAGRCPDCGSAVGHYKGCAVLIRKALG